jgi:hypothetical protein
MQKHHLINIIGAVLTALFFATIGLGVLSGFYSNVPALSNLPHYCMSAFALIFSALFSYGGIYAFFSNLRFLRVAVETEGEVVGEKEEQGSRSIDYSPVIRFSTESGQKMTFISDFGANVGIPKKGSKVKVLYDPEHPHHAKWNNFFFMWILPWIFVAFALLVVFVVLGSMTDLGARISFLKFG